MENVQYKFKVKKIKYIEFDKIIERKQVIIVEEYMSNDGTIITIPSCLNKVLNKWRSKSLNNTRNIAATICSFLNYVKIQVVKGDDDYFANLEHDGLFGLNYYHAANYLNYCITMNEIAYSTVKQYEKRILLFYNYLSQLSILNKDNLCLDFEINDKNPFSSNIFSVNYPKKNNPKLTKLVNMDEYLWQLFLETSQVYAPDITLGVAFQMFGGLRRGEVVNLLIEDLKISRNSKRNQINLHLCDRTNILFANREDIDLSKCQVKRPRKQLVYNFNEELYNYYDRHMEIRNRILKKVGKNTDALFVNKDGSPMTGSQYEYKWDKIKEKFLEKLKENTYGSFVELKKYTWGTHICRGIFTNLCLHYNFAKDARDLANLRGDYFIDSAQAYIDEFKQRKTIEDSYGIINERIEEK